MSFLENGAIYTLANAKSNTILDLSDDEFTIHGWEPTGAVNQKLESDRYLGWDDNMLGDGLALNGRFEGQGGQSQEVFGFVEEEVVEEEVVEEGVEEEEVEEEGVVVEEVVEEDVVEEEVVDDGVVEEEVVEEEVVEEDTYYD